MAQLAAQLEAASAVPPAPSRAYRINYPLACLQLRKARLAQRQRWFDPAPFAEEGLRLLDQLAKGQAFSPTPGKLTEMAYLAANDGSAQPYHLYLPPDYDEKKKYPLIVFLHGYVPTTSILDPWILTETECRIAGELGAMLLIPYGRRNSDFQNVGEVDVLATIREVQSLFPVDDQRLYLSGVSMGGRGVWHLAAHYPGLFAAIAPIAGHTDMPRWWGWDRSKMPVWKLWLNCRDNPIDLAENLRNTPIFVQHGGADSLIPTEQSRLMVARLQELGIPVEYLEHEGASHYIYWEPETYRRSWEFMIKHRLNPSPRHVSLKAYSLDYAAAFWVTGNTFLKWGEPGTAEVEVSADGSVIEAKVGNLGSLNLNLRLAPLVGKANVQIRVGGQVQMAHPQGGGFSWTRLGEATGAGGWCRKRPGLCGPLAQAFNTAFLLVVGTAGNEQQDEALRTQAEKWVDDWEAFADGRPTLVADRELTKEQIEQHNLVLFGTPQTNTVLAQVASHLPIKIGDHRYQIGGRLYHGPTLGLALCYPNPLAPRRLFVVFSGEPWGERLSINHKYDLLPDYIIYDTSTHEYDNTDQHLIAGLFDVNWQIDEALQSRTSEGEAAPREAAVQ